MKWSEHTHCLSMHVPWLLQSSLHASKSHRGPLHPVWHTHLSDMQCPCSPQSMSQLLPTGGNSWQCSPKKGGSQLHLRVVRSQIPRSLQPPQRAAAAYFCFSTQTSVDLSTVLRVGAVSSL